MLELTKDSDIDVLGFERDLTYLGFLYVDREALVTSIDVLTYRIETMHALCKDVMACNTGFALNDLSTKTITKYLIDFEYCPESILYPQGKATPSLDRKKVLDRLYSMGKAREFIDKYIILKSLKSKRGLLKGILESCEKTDKISHDGKPLYKVGFNLREQDNLRFYTSEKNVQSVPRDFLGCFKCPNDYVIVSGDFEQSDLRIAYSLMLRNEQNMDIVYSCTDMYEAFARIFLRDEFDLEDFKENRNSIYKGITLGPIYGETKGNTPKEQYYIDRANEYLNKYCPQYVEFKRRINEKISLGVPLNIESYFGNSQSIPESFNGRPMKDFERRNKALNAPIQTGTSEIVIATERSIMNEFAKVGATPENGGIYAYLTRHDELIFMVKKDFLNHSYIFQNHETVKVDNWFPLKIGFEYLTAFKHPSEDITEFAHRFYSREPELLVKPKEFIPNKFIPVKDTLSVCIGLSKIPEIDSTIMVFYNEKSNKVSADFIPSTEADKLYETVISRIGRNSQALRATGNDMVFVQTDMYMQKSSIYVGILIKFLNNFSNTLFTKSCLIADHLAREYCRNNGIKTHLEDSTFLDNNQEFIKSVLANGELFEV